MLDLRTEYNKLCQQIIAYEPSEAKEIAFLVFNHIFGITKTDLISSMQISEEKLVDINEIIFRINKSEPIQYILEKEWFYGHEFYVNSDVLIPRPETEELVEKAINLKPKTVLDLGTGSGCIPISLALALKESEVFAIDISEKALAVAKANAKKLSANVNFQIANILDFENPFSGNTFDLILSNPPYVKENEKGEIRKNVLDFEPHLALFVKSDDPLVFYKKIAEIGRDLLNENGHILVEINSYLGKETCEVFEKLGYSEVNLIQDFFGKDRMILSKK